MKQPKIYSIVLAGGEGKRLQPLSRDRAKPAIPFAGNYRLVDFALSNLVNAGYSRIIVLTQYKSHSLDVHLDRTWRLSDILGDYVTGVPAQMRDGPRWYEGSADAIYQNIGLIKDENPDYVIVFGADHVYRMDPARMVEQHIESGAGVTVAAIRAPLVYADQFGVIETREDGIGISRFREKPKDAKGLLDAPDQVYASMGNYVFSTKTLIDAVTEDAANPDSKHDIGGNIIPMLTNAGISCVYDFSGNEVPGALEHDKGYWRDVGNIEAFHEAHMDLLSPKPLFNLYNDKWPVFTSSGHEAPSKICVSDCGKEGSACDSLISGGVLIEGGKVIRSVLSPGVRIYPGAFVENSILMHGVSVGRGAVVRNAIIDKEVAIPDEFCVGIDSEKDRSRFHVSDTGIVVIPKREVIKNE